MGLPDLRAPQPALADGVPAVSETPAARRLTYGNGAAPDAHPDRPLSEPLNHKKEWITLSTNPTGLPGRSVLVMTLPEVPLSPVEAAHARRRNEVAYETTVNIQGLPEAHVAWEALADRVLVSATEMSALAEWLFVMGGSITLTPLPWGQTVWTLHSRTWSDSEGVPAVPVHVSVTVSSDEAVMHEVSAAVRR